MQIQFRAAFLRRVQKRVIAGCAVSLALVTCAATRPATARAAEGTYQRVENWAQLPAGTSFGLMSAVGVDAKDNVYAFQREDPTSKILVFNSQGKLLNTWGEGAFPAAHGLRVLRDGFVWLTDKKLEQVHKYSVDGKLLLAIGTKGVDGANDSHDAFNGVSDVIMAQNGDVFVSDGEGPNTRVVKFSKDGKFITLWGTKGAEPGQFNTPHSIDMDSKGRVYVADRSNNRIQIFDQDGKYLDALTQFGARPTSLFITKDDMLYVSASAPENHILVGTTAGKILDEIKGLNGPHGIAVDSTGAIYDAETGGKTIVKFVKK
jgi:DNA-binding beta-propeller fold protein YncE